MGVLGALGVWKVVLGWVIWAHRVVVVVAVAVGMWALVVVEIEVAVVFGYISMRG